MSADATFAERLVTHRQHLKMILRAFGTFKLKDMDNLKKIFNLLSGFRCFAAF